MDEPDGDYLRITEVARLFRVHTETVSRWIAAGRLPSISSPTGRRLIPRAAVAALLQPEPPDEPTPSAA
jgi:excisionase family DNA binding protein